MSFLWVDSLILPPSASLSLCLSFISIVLPPLPERQPKNPTLRRIQGRARRTSTTLEKRQLAFATLKMQMCTRGVEATESRPPLFNPKGIIFGDVGANERVLTAGFYVR